MTVHGCAYESVGGKAESRPALVQGPVLAIAARRGFAGSGEGLLWPWDAIRQILCCLCAPPQGGRQGVAKQLTSSTDRTTQVAKHCITDGSRDRKWIGSDTDAVV
jgi:hypothetical protein